jgi:AcrR family transcriptional regulator
MRRIADELGTSPMAVYGHFASKAELMGAMLDRVWTGGWVPPANRTSRPPATLPLCSEGLDTPAFRLSKEHGSLRDTLGHKREGPADLRSRVPVRARSYPCLAGCRGLGRRTWS